MHGVHGKFSNLESLPLINHALIRDSIQRSMSHRLLSNDLLVAIKKYSEKKFTLQK